VLTVLPWPLEHQAPEDVSIKQHYLNLLEEGRDKAQNLGVPAYAMGHFTISGSLPSGSEESLQLNGEVTFSPADFEGYDYVALGHIHQRQDLGIDTPVVYPSCPMRKSFSEEGDEKGAVLISDHREPQSYERVDVEARPFVTIERDLRGVESPTKALAKAAGRADTENAIVRVRYRTGEDQPVDERAVEEALAGCHKIAAIERQVKRSREGRADSGLGADASTEELIREYAQSRELEEVEDDLVELTRELQERM
jgi:exonuclease SbcD